MTTAYWKSQRKVGHLTKITDAGEVITEIVTEDYKVTDNPIYLGINRTKPGRLPFQFKGNNSLYGCKLPVEGAVFSDRNTKSTALIDLMNPFQIGYNIVNNQIADILVDELGTVILLDQNALPRHSLGEDWGKNNLAKANVAMKNFQMLPLDTSINNTENPLAFQHFQTLNLEQTSRMMSRIQLANYFKQQAFEVIGITPQRLGQQLGQIDTAKGMELALDVTIQAQMLELIKDLQTSQGTAVILITHSLGVVASVCDRVIVMYAGQIAEEAAVGALFERPQHPYTLGLMQSIPRWDASTHEPLKAIPGQPPDMLHPPSGCPFHPRCSTAVAACREQRPDLCEFAHGHSDRCPVAAGVWR